LAALVFVAGIWLFLATATAGRLYDDFAYRGDALLIAVQAIVAGALVGLQNYWLGGAAVYAGTRGLGATTGYRLARHVVGLAMTPFVLAFFTVFPIQLIVFGGDLFRTGGSDEGTAGDVFRGITAGFAVWAIALAVIGVRTVQGWSWPRAGAALGIAAILIGLLGLLAVVL
jgi:Yip1 domain